VNKFLVFLTTLSIAICASAMTLKERKQLRLWQEELSDPKKSYNELVLRHCGVTLPITLEDKLAVAFVEAHTSASGYCESPRSAIYKMCQDPTSKEAIVAKIKKISCKLGKEKEVSFKLNGPELVMTVGLGAPNLDEKTKEFLENNL